jgi:hypothetical protein
MRVAVARFGVVVGVLVASALAGCGGGGSSGGGGSAAAGVSSSTTGSPTSSSTLPSGVLKFLTYNVAGLPQAISSVNPLTNTPKISPLLNGYDLVLVQEDFVYHVELARDARHPYQSVPLTGYSTLVGDGLNTFSKHPFLMVSRVKWNVWYGLFSNANDGLSSKGFSFARHTLGPGVEIDVYDLHADAGGDAGDQDARVVQYDQLADFVEAFSAGRPLLIAGDTNLNTWNRPKDETTFVGFMTRLGLIDAARTLNGQECLDRVLVRSNADVELVPTRWRYADEFVDAAGQPLSDHDAVHVDVTWRRLR